MPPSTSEKYDSVFKCVVILLRSHSFCNRCCQVWQINVVKMNHSLPTERIAFRTQLGATSHVISSAKRGASYRVTMQALYPEARESKPVMVTAGETLVTHLMSI